MAKRKCAACDTPLPVGAHGRRIYCSDQCKRADARSRARAERVVARAHLRCETCGESLAKRRAERFCSKRCAEVARGKVRSTPLPERSCALPGCEAKFLPTGNGLQRCCSREHITALYRLEHADEIKAAREPWNDKRRDYYHRRRALKKRASTGRPVLLAEIADRDGWTCQLCEEQVDPSLAWPDPLSPSLDHTIPLSRGGAHDPDNVQLAHLRCNVAKGDRVA